MMKAKRICSILLILAMLVGLLPTVALATDPATETANFNDDPGKALELLNTYKTGTADSTWDSATNTLTLNGVNFVTSAPTAVRLPEGAKIVLIGANTITGGPGDDCFGITGVGSLTIQGTGTLNVTSGTAGNLSFGIHAETGVTINSGTVTATGGAASNNQSFGIRTLYNDLTITGGTVTAIGGDANVSSNGLWAGNGRVTISGGKVVAESGRVMGVGASSGIYAGNVTINTTGTIVTATGGTAQHGTSYGINAVSGGTVTFSGGTLTAATKGDSCINGTFDAAGNTISFDRNDGVGNMMAITTAAEYTLPANGFTAPAGKQFKGWSVDGAEKAVDETIPVTANTTVKAVWEDITYTVSFVANGGTGTMGSVPNVSGDYTLPANGFTAPAGKQFKGWATSANGTVISGPITIDRNTTLYAIWEPIPVTTYTVSFDANGGTGTMESVPNVSGTYTLPANSFTAPAGKRFKAWSVGGVEKAVGASINVTANTTVTAIWETIPVTTYTVTFIANGGTGTMAAVYGVSGDYTLPANGFTAPAGKRFKAWSVGGVEKTVGDKITVTADTTVTAVWETIPVTTNPITADSSENGDVTISPKNAAKGTTVTLTIVPDKGYTLETLTVTDKDGNEIELTSKEGGAYTFLMPASEVTVEATFMEDNSMLNFFVDVPIDSFYYNAVLWAAEKRITIGVNDTHFAPNATCTRAQAVTFLWRAAGCPDPQGSKTPFTDVVKGSFYETAVLWATEEGITNGTSATKFSPDAICDRAQFATLLWRAQGKPAAGTTNPFTDVKEGAYYTDAVLWAVKNGITKGTSATTFSPHHKCSRAEAVTFLYRALG